MQVRELVDLASFLKTFIRERNLVQTHTDLISAVKQAAQNQNPEQVVNAFERLQSIHRDASQVLLSPAQQRLLVAFDGSGLIGDRANRRLEGLFQQYRVHPQGLVAALQEMLTETNRFVSRCDQLIEALDPLISAQPAEEAATETEGTLWLSFEHGTAVQTIEDLEKAADTWKSVLHHFSRMPNAVADSGRIISLQKFSPLEVNIAAGIAILVPLAYGIKYLLDRIQQVVEILKQIEQLKEMKVKNSILKDLRAEARERRKKIVAEAADAVQKEFKADPEARNAAEKGLEKVLGFLEKGGQLDIDLADAEPEESGNGEDKEDSSRKYTAIPELVAAIRKQSRLLGDGQASQSLLPPPDGADD